MLFRVVPLTTLLVFALGTLALAQKNQASIFRAINIKDGKTALSLGDDFSKFSELFDTIDEGFGLKEHFFGGAEKIFVKLNDEKRIHSIFFIYDSKKNFNIAKDNYLKTLGKPAGEMLLNAKSISVKVVFWEDSKTRFELTEKVERGKILVSSALFDKK